MNTCSTVQKCNSFFHSDGFAMIMPRDREADQRQCLPIYLISMIQIGPDMQVHQRLYWSNYLYIFYHSNLKGDLIFNTIEQTVARNPRESTATFLTGHWEGWFRRFARRMPLVDNLLKEGQCSARQKRVLEFCPSWFAILSCSAIKLRVGTYFHQIAGRYYY